LIRTRLRRKILSGKIVIHPTESCFGIGCDPNCINSLIKISQVKKRSKNKSYLLIGSSINNFRKFITPINKTDLSEIQKKWPGHHTWLLKKQFNCNQLLSPKNNTIGCRIPDHNFMRSILKDIGMAITSTSANKSGQKSIKSIRECFRKYNKLGYIIKYKVGFYDKPSTIQNFESKVIYR
jgi:L-threonylcarbamoyladenylate synthase